MLLATPIFFKGTWNKCFFLPYSDAPVWFTCFRSSHQKVFWKMRFLQTILQIHLWKSSVLVKLPCADALRTMKSISCISSDFAKTLSHFLLIDQKLEENWFRRTHVDAGYFWYFQTTYCNINILVWPKKSVVETTRKQCLLWWSSMRKT